MDIGIRPATLKATIDALNIACQPQGAVFNRIAGREVAQVRVLHA